MARARLELTYGDVPTNWQFWKAMYSYPYAVLPVRIGYTYETVRKLVKTTMGRPKGLFR